MTEEQRGHANFAPSASHRWMACPASLTLLPEEHDEGAPSEYAHEGTVLHDISARCLKNNYSPDAHLGKIVDDLVITQEHVDAVQSYIDEVRGMAKEYKALGGKIEFEVDIAEDCWGTIDALLWNKDLVIIDDAKYGKGVIVEAEENTQLKLYGIGALKYLQRDHGLAPEKVILMIHQPRTINPIRRWETTRKELITWFQDAVQPAMARVKNGDTECSPGTTQCRWCPLSSTCSAQSEALVSDAEVAFKEFVKVELMTVHDVAKLLPKIEHIQNWIKTIKEYALSKALEGDEIPGYKLVEGRSVRKWSADDDKVEKFVKQFDVEPWVKKLISVSQAEKAIGKTKLKNSVFEKLYTKPQGKPTLVPIDDRRPEWVESVEQEFQEFVEETATSGTLGMKSGSSIEFVASDDPTSIKGSGMVEPILIDDPGLSAWDKLTNGGDEDDDVGEFLTESSEDDSKDLEETLSSDGKEPMVIMKGRSERKVPKKGTKRMDVLNFGKGGVTIDEAVKSLNTTENMIKMHLRYLNEENGYEVIIYDDNTFTVK